MMTRDEFDEWLEDHTSDALDEIPQSDATVERWLSRLHMALKVVAKEEEREEIEESGDPFSEDGEDDDAEEEEEEEGEEGEEDS